jgi:hypothetical protein
MNGTEIRLNVGGLSVAVTWTSEIVLEGLSSAFLTD